MLEAHELDEGRDYFILLTTSGGLYRYDIHDVVRCVGFEGQAPLLEFLNKGKSFSNLTGEKLSEHQVIRAVERSFRELGLAIDTFTLAPVMEDMPRYVLLVEPHVHQGRARELARARASEPGARQRRVCGKVCQRPAAAGSQCAKCRPERGTNCGRKRPASAAISRNTSILPGGRSGICSARLAALSRFRHVQPPEYHSEVYRSRLSKPQLLRVGRSRTRLC